IRRLTHSPLFPYTTLFRSELGVVHERLGERDTLLEPRRELAVGRPPVGAELAELDQLVDAPSELLPAEPVEAAVERDDLPDAQRSEEHTSELQSRSDLVCR